MPTINKQPFEPNPIPDNLAPDAEVFYHELTNEIFTDYDEFVDRFLFCNSLIWSCSRTGKSGLTFKEALDSEEALPFKKRKYTKQKRKQPDSQQEAGSGDNSSLNASSLLASAGHGTGPGSRGSSQNMSIDPFTGQPIKKKKKKYPYDPKKYSMPVPEGFDPSLLTPTGKIDGRKLKSKKNKELAEELLARAAALAAQKQPGKRGRWGKRKLEESSKPKEDDTKKREEEAKKKAQMQAELARERELEAKRRKEAAALARQLERQRKEEEKKKQVAFLTNWEKKCEDLQRDDLKRLPHPTPLECDIPAALFGDAIYILESLYNLHELYNFGEVFSEGITYDILESILFEKQPDGPLSTLVQFLLRTIFVNQPTNDGYGLSDDISETTKTDGNKQESVKAEAEAKTENDTEHSQENETNGKDHHSDAEEDDDNDDDVDKDVNMNDLIGSAIRAAREVRLSLAKPLAEMELDSSTVTEILKLHLLQSGSFPKGRTIHNGWYSSREDPGLWLCMQEPDLIKKLDEVTIFDLDIEERLRILHTLINQLFTFIRTRVYIESASNQLTELRKEYRKLTAAFGKWDLENRVRRMWPPKRKSEQGTAGLNQSTNTDKSNGAHVKSEHNHEASNPASLNDCDDDDGSNQEVPGSELSKHGKSKSCLKQNGTCDPNDVHNTDETKHSAKKKISFKNMNGAISGDDTEEYDGEKAHNGGEADSEQTFEELERAYQQNLVDYEDYQREKAIRQEELNQELLNIRTNLRNTQAIYGIHPIGRDRTYRRYWLFQSLPGLFVEQDDEYVGRCLKEPTPLESQYKKLFGKENPLMHPNEADLIRTTATRTSESISASSDRHENEQNQSGFAAAVSKSDDINNGGSKSKVKSENCDDDQQPNNKSHEDSGNCENENDLDNEDGHAIGLNGEHESHEPESDEMSLCTGDETTCVIHGQKRPTQTRWWFFSTPESIDALVKGLNKRGIRESELLDTLEFESSILKPWIAKCPAYKLNKRILEQSGIRRSRRIKTRGPSKRRARNYD